MPDNQKVYTLFRPEPEVDIAIEERLRHFKRYPEDLPEEISQILAPKKDWAAQELADLISTEKSPEFIGTSFGREIEKTVGLGISDVMISLASLCSSTMPQGKAASLFSRAEFKLESRLPLPLSTSSTTKRPPLRHQS